MAEIVGIGGDEKEGKKFRKEKFDNNIIIIIMILWSMIIKYNKINTGIYIYDDARWCRARQEE